MTMNDQETISSRSSLDTDRIEEPHHDDDLDTSSSTSESTSIISNPLHQDVTLMCKSILAHRPESAQSLPYRRRSRRFPALRRVEPRGRDIYVQIVCLVSRTSLIEHQPHMNTNNTTNNNTINDRLDVILTFSCRVFQTMERKQQLKQ